MTCEGMGPGQPLVPLAHTRPALAHGPHAQATRTPLKSAHFLPGCLARPLPSSNDLMAGSDVEYSA
jgi:hypothetical protein